MERQQQVYVLKVVASLAVDLILSPKILVQPVKTLLRSPAKINNSEAHTRSLMVLCLALSLRDMVAHKRKRPRLEAQVPGYRLLPPMEDRLKPVFKYDKDNDKEIARLETLQETSKTSQCLKKTRCLQEGTFKIQVTT